VASFDAPFVALAFTAGFVVAVGFVLAVGFVVAAGLLAPPTLALLVPRAVTEEGADGFPAFDFFLMLAI